MDRQEMRPNMVKKGTLGILKVMRSEFLAFPERVTGRRFVVEE